MLKDLRLTNRVNQIWDTSGIDSPESCLDPRHYKSYPYSVQYHYNSRGFRDQEWPTNIQNAVWAIGDSFTVGLGSAVAHTWPWLLQQQLEQRVINVSMDGASNNWIARRGRQIIEQTTPAMVVLQWSHIERREHGDTDYANKRWLLHYNSVKTPDWPACPELQDWNSLPEPIITELLTQHDQAWRHGISDEQLRLGHIKSTDEQDVANTLECMHRIESAAGTDTCIIHSFIPDFAVGPALDQIMSAVISENWNFVPPIQVLDLARDGYHYDVLTAKKFVNDLLAQDCVGNLVQSCAKY